MSMSLSKWEPFKELKEIEERFNQLFPRGAEMESSLVDFSPSVNTREGDYAYHIEVDLPGVKKKDISVEVKDSRLIISGERKSNKEVKKENYHRVESSYGKFERSFSLPDNVDAENIDAQTKDGVLEVIVPKKERTKASKKVDVK